MREPTFPFITLPNWVKAASRCGFNIEPILQQHGIVTDGLALDQIRISERSVDRIMEDCVARSEGDYFPFVLGETFAFEYLSDLETFVTTSRTMREAARVFIWLRRFVNPLLIVQLEERGSQASLVLSNEDGRAVKQHHAEALFASTLKFARMLFGREPEFRFLSFCTAQAVPGVDYEGFFGMPVRFGAARTEVCFQRALLDLPLKGDFPALHQQAEASIQQRLHDVSHGGPLAGALQQLFAQQPELLGRGIEAAAGQLHLHPRTLQRHLRREGAGFFEIQDALRFKAASQALQAGEPDLESLSERLGFSDRRSFTRAFKRWSGGSTPSEFRNSTGPTRAS